ncbi:MAG: hypothetical protein IJZ46_04930 [Bacilli bacterium]|nr:hypothetical protein [Bacilli bacterium]
MKKKYDIKPNNYIGTIFVSLVIISAAYILSVLLSNNGSSQKLEEKPKDINLNEITSQDELLTELQYYLNPGNTYTNKIYQSMYISNQEVNNTNIDDESILYIAYNYLLSNTDANLQNRTLTCEDQNNLGLNILDCSIDQTNQTKYIINSSISKEELNNIILKIFNRNIQNYTNFYFDKNSICYHINNEYYCIKENTNEINTPNTKVYFEKAYSSNNTIDIIQTYKYSNGKENFTGFLSDEVGEGKYISRFQKINGEYHWISTKRYIEN